MVKKWDKIWQEHNLRIAGMLLIVFAGVVSSYANFLE